MATIRDVAREAGVSVSTVSKVINSSDFGKESTRARVFEAMERLNYRPHAVARSLVTKRSDTIGLVLPDLMNPVFPIVAHSVERAARALGYHVLLGVTDRDKAAEKQYLQVLLENRTDGVVLFGGLDVESIRILRQEKVPVVIIERPTKVAGADVLTTDNVEGAYLATKHLIDLGRKRIGLVTGPLWGEVERDRADGYRQALEDSGLVYDPELVVECGYSVEEGLRASETLFSRASDLDAVFAVCDLMAVGVLRYLEAIGRRVPDDVALVGFDNTVGQFSSPPLTSVEQPLEELSNEAVRLLIEQIKSPNKRPPKRLIIAPRLVVRESTVRMAGK